MEGLKLYSYFRSSCSYRVRIALNLKGLPYEVIPVNLLKGEQKSSEYLMNNPQGLVPALLHGDFLLTQSLAMLEYLEERFPSPSLMPIKPEERALVRALALTICADTQPVQNLRVLKYVKNELGLGEEGKQAWGRKFIGEGLQAYEELMKKCPEGKYSFGNQVSIADVCLIPQLFNARRFQVDLDRLPGIKRVEMNLVKLKAFELARPENQIDCPEELK